MATLGHAHWFFGNLYEAVVRMPERLAEAPPTTGGPLGPGSPARYYLPAAPFMVGATLAAAVSGWDRTEDRRALVASGLLSASAIALSAHLIRTVNVPLLRGETPIGAERERLLRHWHHVNTVRLVAVAAAMLALRRVARNGLSTDISTCGQTPVRGVSAGVPHLGREDSDA